MGEARRRKLAGYVPSNEPKVKHKRLKPHEVYRTLFGDIDPLALAALLPMMTRRGVQRRSIETEVDIDAR